MITANRTSVEWKCLECGIIISTATVIGSYYCTEVCREKIRSSWAKRRHKTRKLANAKRHEEQQIILSYDKPPYLYI